MNWRWKARIQNLVAALPKDLSYSAYYFLQRKMGALREVDPTNRMRAGIALMDKIRQQNRSAEGGTFLEVGTGRQIQVPIALWLCGAKSVVTVDLNPYLKAELVMQNIAFIRDNDEAMRQLFGDYAKQAIFCERVEMLRRAPDDFQALLNLMNIRYMAPADARKLDLPAGSIDYHISYTVLEHIPSEVMLSIFQEGKRLLKPDGLFVHFIDFSDHFAQSDSSICLSNFLRFSEKEWDRLAGNRFMYHNRLRLDEFQAILEQSGVQVLAMEPTIDPRSLEELKSGRLPLDARFAGKSPETNASKNAWVTATR